MRRIALLGFTLLLPALALPGCTEFSLKPTTYVADPTVGLPGMIGDTHTFTALPTTPPAQSDNERRARGEDTATAPLLPEPGDVWPGPPPPIPTMQDLQNLGNEPQLPLPNIPNGLAPPVFPRNVPLPPGKAAQ
jgi:hypothetical protein